MSEEKAKTLSLFSILPDEPPELRGIARLAAQGEHAGDGHLVEFRTLPVRSLMNKSVSKRMHWFMQAINPYRGCEFACRYCYARYTHEFMEMKDPLEFERKIYVKQNAAWLLEQEIRKLHPEEQIAIGTATDPYQPIERSARVTRSILEVLARRSGLRLGIVTKSTLITRDIELLRTIARRSRLSINITITTPDADLARILEPRAPRPDLRFQIVKRLREAGLRVGILCSPLLPGITDNIHALEAMARHAKEADACFFYANPLFLKPCSKGVFLAFVREHFPALESSYERRYQDAAFVSKAYRKRVADLVDVVTRKYDLGPRFPQDLTPPPSSISEQELSAPIQTELWPAEKPRLRRKDTQPVQLGGTSTGAPLQHGAK